MKNISCLVLLLVVSGCASTPTVTTTSAPVSATPKCADLVSANGAPTDPNPNEVRQADCR